MPPGEPILRVRGLIKHYPVRSGPLRRQTGAVHAVDGVDLDLYEGESVGLVGESGCGKTTLARCLVRLERPTGGHIYYGGSDIADARGDLLRQMRREVQMVFQDPYASLNPRMTVADIVTEPWYIHRGLVPRRTWRDRAVELLGQVGLSETHLDRYPSQLSGGQRQRVGIARALALRPRVLVCDEPVSSLDVSVQAQVINLLKDLQESLGLSYIFISHDLSVVRQICDRVAVMYLGQVVEIGTEDRVYGAATHPYTQALLSAVPAPGVGAAERIVLSGDVPDPADPPSGCRFRTRCPIATARCATDPPELADRGFDHPSRCHYAGVRRLAA